MYQQLPENPHLLRTRAESNRSRLRRDLFENEGNECVAYLCFNDALHWAGSDTLGGIVVTFALHTGRLIDNVQNAVTFADGFSGAFGNARATGDAIFSDFHGHDSYSSLKYLLRI